MSPDLRSSRPIYRQHTAMERAGPISTNQGMFARGQRRLGSEPGLEKPYRAPAWGLTRDPLPPDYPVRRLEDWIRASETVFGVLRKVDRWVRSRVRRR